MEYFAIDVGGSSIKYAVINEEMRILKNGKAESRHLQTPEEFVSCIKELYVQNGSCNGGIAVSYCGEVNNCTGYLYSGGSYRFMAGNNLKKLLEEACGTKVSIENDGNCAGLAESRYGALRGFTDCAALVIGTGLGGAIILNGTLHSGIHGYAGSASILVRDIEKKFTKQSWAFRIAGAAYPGKRYAEIKGYEEPLDGFAFFQKVIENDETAITVLQEYASTLANIILNMHLILDLEAIAIGGGISQQPVLKEYIQKAFDDIYSAEGMAALNLPKPEIRVCQHHNDANLLGALVHHLDQINKGN